MPEELSVDAQLSKFLGPVDYTTPVSELKARIDRKGDFTGRRLVGELERLASRAGLLESEQSRVLIARVLVALVPGSLSLIESYLHTTHVSEESAELQFSLFVALSELPALLDDSRLLSMITDMVRRYLLGIDTAASQAAWMAGDLLGDHWPVLLALPVLVDVAKTAGHAPGREGAIHGLSHALSRTSKRDQWRIIQALKNVATSDTNESVRRSAEMAMSSLRGL